MLIGSCRYDDQMDCACKNPACMLAAMAGFVDASETIPGPIVVEKVTALAVCATGSKNATARKKVRPTRAANAKVLMQFISPPLKMLCLSSMSAQGAARERKSALPWHVSPPCAAKQDSASKIRQEADDS
jgi:hypothetical protein